MGGGGTGGVLQAEPLGSYLYEKGAGSYHVTVFLLQVTEVAQDWPERSIRIRSWVSTKGALERIDESGLVDLLRATFENHSHEFALAKE